MLAHAKDTTETCVQIILMQQLTGRSKPQQPRTTTAEAKTALDSATAAYGKEKTEKLKLATESKQALHDALLLFDEATTQRSNAFTKDESATEGEAKANAKIELDKAEEKLAQAQERAVHLESVGSIRQEQ